MALYGGVAVGLSQIVNPGRAKLADAMTAASGSRLRTATVAVQGLAIAPIANVAAIGLPAAGGALISLGADKLGINKMLARAKFPLRV